MWTPNWERYFASIWWGNRKMYVVRLAAWCWCGSIARIHSYVPYDFFGSNLLGLSSFLALAHWSSCYSVDSHSYTKDTCHISIPEGAHHTAIEKRYRTTNAWDRAFRMKWIRKKVLDALVCAWTFSMRADRTEGNEWERVGRIGNDGLWGGRERGPNCQLKAILQC